MCQGLQITQCDALGLNCFNATSFREDLSALVGTVKPNEVRLVKPNTCLVAIQEMLFDGVKRNLPQSMLRKEMCGPWPGLPPTGKYCACGKMSDPTLEVKRRCYYGLGTGMISPYVGTAALVYSGTNASGSSEVATAQTVGACALLAAELESNAFLYHPGQLKCSPRTVLATELGLDPCPSQYKLCREAAYYMRGGCESGGECDGLLVPGMQMYIAVSNAQETSAIDFASKCSVLIEDCNVASKSVYQQTGACDSRLKSPLDSFYYLVNLHAETKSDLVHAFKVLNGQEGSGTQRLDFMKKYQITQLAISEDKSIAADAPEREVNVLASGHLDVKEGVLFESTAICETDGVYTPALCCSSDLCLTSPDTNPAHPEQPEAICKWDATSLPPESKASCATGYRPRCLGGKNPRCLGSHMFDPNPLTYMPMPCIHAGGRLRYRWVCAHSTIFFKNPTPMTATLRGQCTPEPGETLRSECTIRPAQMLVTRVEIALADETNLGSRGVQLSFSDGSDQIINLTVTAPTLGAPLADARTRSYYIRPVVTEFVTLSSVPYEKRDEKGDLTGEWYFSGPPLRVAKFEVYGQSMAKVFERKAHVNIFQPGYVGGQEKYACPPTTFANSREDVQVSQLLPAGATPDIFTGCDVCAYPMMSKEGSTVIVNCTSNVCGDGRVSWQSSEQCDDGNRVLNDGCASDCKVEPLQLCRGPADANTGVGLPIKSYSQKDTCFRLGSAWTSYNLAPWDARYGHTAVIHEKGLWLVGGISSDAKVFFNDVWYETTNGGGCLAPEADDESRGYFPCQSNNGLEWEPVARLTIAPRSSKDETLAWYKNRKVFEPRGFHGLVDHGGFLWVVGGANRLEWPYLPQSEDTVCSPDLGCEVNQVFDDVWKASPTRGPLEWHFVEPTGSNRWDPRFQHGVVSFKDKIWIMGGGSVSVTERSWTVELHNDLWWSREGQEWVNEFRDVEVAPVQILKSTFNIDIY